MATFITVMVAVIIISTPSWGISTILTIQNTSTDGSSASTIRSISTYTHPAAPGIQLDWQVSDGNPPVLRPRPPKGPASISSASSITGPYDPSNTLQITSLPVQTKTGEALSNETGLVGGSTSSSSSSDDLSSGAVAGIAIGCILLGCLIGLLAAFLLFRRKKTKRLITKPGILPDPTNQAKHHYSDIKLSLLNSNELRLDQFLLDAPPDRDIIRELQSLGSLIKQHVENYYHLNPVDINPGYLFKALQDLGISDGKNSNHLGVQDITKVCLDPKTRQSGLCHIIQRVVYGSLRLGQLLQSQNIPSLLPAPMVSFIKAIPVGKKTRGRFDSDGDFRDIQEGFEDITTYTNTAAATSIALQKWRTLSAYLLHPDRTQRTPLPIHHPSLTHQTQELTHLLNIFLQHFVLQNSNNRMNEVEGQEGHLQAVMMECAKLGAMLMSHPTSEWEFVTDVATSSKGVGGGADNWWDVVVEAGINKLNSSVGSGVHRVVEPVVVRVR